MWLVARGRQDLPPGGDGVHYSAQLCARFWVFLFVFPVEIVLFEVLLPWRTVRLVVLCWESWVWSGIWG